MSGGERGRVRGSVVNEKKICVINKQKYWMREWQKIDVYLWLCSLFFSLSYFPSFLCLFLSNNPGDTIISNHISSYPLSFTLRLLLNKLSFRQGDERARDTLLFHIILVIFGQQRKTKIFEKNNKIYQVAANRGQKGRKERKKNLKS